MSVLHHTASALYVEVDGRCVGVVAPGAAQVPCALRIAGVSATTVLTVRAPSPYVERGTLYLTDDPLEVGRFVDVRVPRIDLGRLPRRAAGPANAKVRPPRPSRDGLAAYKDLPEGRTTALPFPWPSRDGLAAYKDLPQGRTTALPFPWPSRDGLAAYQDLPQGDGLAAYQDLPEHLDDATIGTLVGHGGGLTPLGDDVLCGWLAVLHATDRLDDEVAALVRAALDRTTLLSATLLDCALHGEVLPEFASYVRALGTPGETEAVRALTAIGHTSGAGLWWGARHALTIIALENVA